MPVRCNPPVTGRDTIKRWKRTMQFTPDLDERAAVLSLVANATRLKLFYVLDRLGAVCVCDLGEILGITQSAVSQHLAKMRAYGMVAARREAQTLYYSITETAETKMLRKIVLAGIEADLGDDREDG